MAKLPSEYPWISVWAGLNLLSVGGNGGKNWEKGKGERKGKRREGKKEKEKKRGKKGGERWKKEEKKRKKGKNRKKERKKETSVLASSCSRFCTNAASLSLLLGGEELHPFSQQEQEEGILLGSTGAAASGDWCLFPPPAGSHLHRSRSFCVDLE